MRDFKYQSIPRKIRNMLSVGCTGTLHMTGICRELLDLLGNANARAVDREFAARNAFQMLMAAWMEDPLNGSLAKTALTVARNVRGFNPKLASVLEAVSKAWKPNSYLTRLQQRDEVEKSLDYIKDNLKNNPYDMFMLSRLVDIAVSDQELESVRKYFDQPWSGALEPLRLVVSANLNLLSGDFNAALVRYEQALSIIDLPTLKFRMAQCLLRLGKQDEATSLLFAVLKSIPWNTNTILKLHDLLYGFNRDCEKLDGGLNVLLYTYNKEQEIGRTLDLLVGTLPEDSRVTVLVNGCSDNTLEAVRSRETGFGPEGVEVVNLPVNIGAPAARNWLLSMEGMEKRPWTVYLDDDALVPPDWVDRLAMAVKVYPNAGVWGCRVLDASRPYLVQSADLHIRPDYKVEGNLSFEVETSDIQIQTQDYGQFDYLRPCVSVTGCCHMFRTRELLESKGFDIRFSPSQFDDLDRDLSMFLNGRDAVYQGHLAIHHLKSTGSASRHSSLEAGNALGNNLKLQNKYSARDVSGMDDRDQQNQILDLEVKLARIWDYFSEN